MFRLTLILLLLPTFAAADWSPRPSMFRYEATFANCIAIPSENDLARTCARAITQAYVLKRAVAWAAHNCFPENLSTCALPFEDEGLPAIAAQIAVDAGCDATNVLDFPEDEPLPADHCITIASDIMIDEGVVPLNTEISCGLLWIECGDISLINATFWAEKVNEVALNDPSFTADLQSRNREDCAQEAQDIGSWDEVMDAMMCEADRSAALWADLAVQNLQDQ